MVMFSLELQWATDQGYSLWKVHVMACCTHGNLTRPFPTYHLRVLYAKLLNNNCLQFVFIFSGVQKILRINARIWWSPEYAAFRECYADILTAIQSPEQLANRLYSQKVIHTDVHDEVHLDPQTKRKKSRILLLAVEQAIRTHPTNFQVLVDALHQEATSGMQTVCCRLERLYHCRFL